jgi:hypothetical protein
MLHREGAQGIETMMALPMNEVQELGNQLKQWWTVHGPNFVARQIDKYAN